jgi:catechol 2,3-dioxygenase-like lactoylglutathione lyase family enzyme
MEWKLELVAIPVSDVDRAKAFYTEKVGFNADHDHRVSDEVRFVQLTPPGSACSIALGTGISRAEPGSVQGMQMVVPDVEAARGARRARDGGQRGTGVRLGHVRVLRRSGRQRLGRAAAAQSRVGYRKEDEHG